MNVQIVRHALDRVPLSLIIDDSTLLVNLNYFFMRDRNLVDGQGRRWEDVPVVHPEWFTRQFGAWCLEQGVRGKFSMVPNPAGLGRLDRGLPLFSARQQDSWLNMCHEVIVPAFDITPEMLTHTWVTDPQTGKRHPDAIWEQYDWETLPVDREGEVRAYIAEACRILANIGLSPQGVTSPGGFGGRTLAFYMRVAGEAVREVTGNPTPYVFKRLDARGPVDTYVWHQDPAAGRAVGEIVAATDDRTGSWTGYGLADPDYYITEDLSMGRLAQVIAAGDPAILCSHWQGFYGLHADDQRGFKTLKTVVARLKALDTAGERTRWRTCSEIATYACMRAMASITVGHSPDPAEGVAHSPRLEEAARGLWKGCTEGGARIVLELPVRAPELTLAVDIASVREVCADGVPLERAVKRSGFEAGTYLVEGGRTLIAFDPVGPRTMVEIA